MLDFEKMPRFAGFSFPITMKITEWSAAFEVPDEEIERQIKIAHAWADNNPKKAPKKDILRYLNNWLNIADRKGSLRRSSKPVPPRAPDTEGDMTMEDLRAIRQKNFPQYKPDPCKFTDIIDSTIEPPKK
jgi:hypothetical protein